MLENNIKLACEKSGRDMKDVTLIAVVRQNRIGLL